MVEEGLGEGVDALLVVVAGGPEGGKGGGVGEAGGAECDGRGAGGTGGCGGALGGGFGGRWWRASLLPATAPPLRLLRDGKGGDVAAESGEFGSGCLEGGFVAGCCAGLDLEVLLEVNDARVEDREIGGWSGLVEECSAQ